MLFRSAESMKLFGKPVSELTLAECASLAGITKNPARYDPLTHPDNNLARRDYILYEMWQQGYISEEEYNEATAQPVATSPGSVEVKKTQTTSYFTDKLIEDVSDGLMEEYGLRQASQQEIQEFGAQLAQFGLTFSQVADNSPKQARTLTACHRVLDYARQTPHLLDRFLETQRLPIKELSQGAGVDKKTIERHRAYLVAILLAFTNGYEIIRGHLQFMKRKEKPL